MVWTTTGNLTNMRNNAKFDFGVAMLPAAKRKGSPTGSEKEADRILRSYK